MRTRSPAAPSRNGAVLINDRLKTYGLEDRNFLPAGANRSTPDALLAYRGSEYKIEVKLNLRVDFGQGSLAYDTDERVWKLSGLETEEAKSMRSFMSGIGVEEIVNREWGYKGIPKRVEIPLNELTPADVAEDYKRFTNLYVEVPWTSVNDYYSSKGTHYIQVGKYGFYSMNGDPASLGVPEFKPDLKLRVRIKRSKSKPIYSYRFTTALRAVSLEQSSYDLENHAYLQTLSIGSRTSSG